MKRIDEEKLCQEIEITKELGPVFPDIYENFMDIIAKESQIEEIEGDLELATAW